jgi:hypothetical protein
MKDVKQTRQSIEKQERIEFRKKKREKALFGQLEAGTIWNAELARYWHLPGAPIQVVLNVL